MSDREFEDDLDGYEEEEELLVDDESADTSPYYSPQIDPINAAAMAAVRDHLPIDDSLILSLFVDLETLRSMLGAKDEVVNRACSDMESSLRTMILGWARQPVPMVKAIYRKADRDSQRRIHQALTAFVAELDAE